MIPVRYSFRNLMVRWRTTVMTAGGFTLVVAALILMLAFVNGIRQVNAVTGDPLNVLVLSQGNDDEVISRLDHEVVLQAEMAPGVARGEDGRLLASRELFMVMQPQSDSLGDRPFLQVRGCEPNAFVVHDTVRLREGRRYREGSQEAIVGSAVAREQGWSVGDTVAIGRQRWKIVGVFSAGGAAYESEIWCDLHPLAAQFHRVGSYSTLVLRVENEQAVERVIDHLIEGRLTDVEAIPERAYYQEQAEQATLIAGGAIVIAAFMGIGTVLGVTNTMFAALGARVKDIAVLQLMGFGKVEILLAFLAEALLIAAIGGSLGLLVGLAANGLTLSTAVGGKSIAFAFAVDSAIISFSIVFTLMIGLLGGLLPALSAMRVSPLEALR